MVTGVPTYGITKQFCKYLAIFMNRFSVTDFCLINLTTKALKETADYYITSDLSLIHILDVYKRQSYCRPLI